MPTPRTFRSTSHAAPSGIEVRRVVQPLVRLRPPVAPAGRQQHDLVARSRPVACFASMSAVIGRIRADPAQVHDPGRAGEPVERDVVQAGPAGDLVQRGIDVRAGVVRQRQHLDPPAVLRVVARISDFTGGWTGQFGLPSYMGWDRSMRFMTAIPPATLC